MKAVIALPFLWLGVFFLLPFALVLAIALGTNSPDSVPPVELGASLKNFALLFTDDLYLSAWITSLRIAATSTLVTLLLGYPMAYAIARASSGWRAVLLMLVVLPFWTSFLIRVYAWMGILSTNGLLNNLLLWLGVISEPLALMHSDFAIYLGIVYSYLPFMVLPLYATLSRMDMSLLEAAADLGAPPWKAFVSVTLPLSLPGIIAGCLLVVIPATGEFVIPDLLGGPDALMIGKILWTEFFTNRDWPMASALATGLVVLLVGPFAGLQMLRSRQARAAENAP